MLVVICGVSGCGKTSVAQELAKQLNWKFEDADDYHTEENKRFMQQGVSLNDTNRLPWLLKLRKILVDWHTNKESGVLACSALKKRYRHLLSSNLNYSEEFSDRSDQNSFKLNIQFVLLNFKRQVIEERLEKRLGHPILQDSRILTSQFEALEIPSIKENKVLYQNLHGYLCIEATRENESFHHFLNLHDLNNSDSVAEIGEVIMEILNYPTLSISTNIIV